MDDFLNSNEAKWRLARTIVQGIIGAAIMYLPDLIGLVDMPPQVAAFGTAVIMAILSPFMAVLGDRDA